MKRDRAVVTCIVKAVQDAERRTGKASNRTAADNVPCHIQAFIRKAIHELKRAERDRRRIMEIRRSSMISG